MSRGWRDAWDGFTWSALRLTRTVLGRRLFGTRSRLSAASPGLVLHRCQALSLSTSLKRQTIDAGLPRSNPPRFHSKLWQGRVFYLIKWPQLAETRQRHLILLTLPGNLLGADGSVRKLEGKYTHTRFIHFLQSVQWRPFWLCERPLIYVGCVRGLLMLTEGNMLSGWHCKCEEFASESGAHHNTH